MKIVNTQKALDKVLIMTNADATQSTFWPCMTWFRD
jgi:hypothetical protein